MIVGTLVVLAIWYDRYLTIPDKYAYNEIHRFTSWAPVIGTILSPMTALSDWSAKFDGLQDT
jgi:hypothetical protein